MSDPAEQHSTVKWIPWHKWAAARLTHVFGAHVVPLLCSWVALSCVAALTLFVLYMTFVPGLPVDTGFTLSHWAELLDSYLFIKVIPNTVIVGVGTVLVTIFFAGPLAWLLNRTTLPGRNIFMALIATVVVVPRLCQSHGLDHVGERADRHPEQLTGKSAGIGEHSHQFKQSLWNGMGDGIGVNSIHVLPHFWSHACSGSLFGRSGWGIGCKSMVDVHASQFATGMAGYCGRGHL